MFISRIILCFLLLTLPLALLGQNATLNSTSGATAGAAGETTAPKLEHFDPNLTDQSLNPCDDFYKYSCNKWITANPIPADQVYWTTGSSLELWNENALRETLEASSRNDPARGAVQQKIGDYWAACMDESGIEAAGLKPLQPELDRIAALKSKRELTLRLHICITCFPEHGRGTTIRRTHRSSVSAVGRTLTMLPKWSRRSIRAA